MAANPRIRRLALVPFEGPDDTLRRYRLARMDEIALATPPDPAAAERRNGHGANGSEPARPEAGGPAAATPAGEPAPRA
jgi:hypothetical protein